MFNKICSFESLLKSYLEARRGKRYQNKVCNFDFFLESNLLKIKEDLLSGKYTPLPYHHFVVTDPKKRNVAAPNFRDRVAQHSLVSMIEPIFEKQFIIDSYACRKGKGTSFGLKRVKRFLQAVRCINGKEKDIYVLQCDIEKYFKSIGWDILIGIIGKTIRCPKTIDMIVKIITTHQSDAESTSAQLQLDFEEEIVSVAKRRGLPIGNLTSQLFANVYLNQLDHYVKENLREKRYARYMDDFLIIHPDKEHLKETRDKIRKFLEEKLKLKLHPKKLTIKNIKDGIPFLGCRIFYDHILVRGSTLIRMQRKYKRRKKQLLKGFINDAEFLCSKKSQEGHLKQVNAWKLKQRMFGQNPR